MNKQEKLERKKRVEASTRYVEKLKAEGIVACKIMVPLDLRSLFGPLAQKTRERDESVIEFLQSLALEDNAKQKQVYLSKADRALERVKELEDKVKEMQSNLK